MFHKVKKVEPLKDMELKIEFISGEIKYYDVKKLINLIIYKIKNYLKKLKLTKADMVLVGIKI